MPKGSSPSMTCRSITTFIFCRELSEDAIKNGAMLYIAPFSRWDMWKTVDVNWQMYDVAEGWAKMQSKNIVTYLRHLAPLWRNRFNHTIPMDRGGWVSVRDLAGALGLSVDDLLSILRAMSLDPKDRCQVSMLYRKDMTPDGPVWTNFGVALVRACQGHSIPWIVPERLGEEIKHDELGRIACLCHGTTFDALPNILSGSLKPASMVEPGKYRRPGSRPQRPATGGTGQSGRTLVRNVLMMSPYPYFDHKRYVSGARKDSKLYVFLQKERVSELMAESDRKLYLTHRTAVISCHDWPWDCIQAVIAPGFQRGGSNDRVIYHEFARK